MRKNLLFKIIGVFIGIFISLVAAELILRVQNYVQLDGFNIQHPWNSTFHHGSDAFSVREFGSNCNGEKIKLLLLGDSWMAPEYPLSQTIEQEFADKANKCVQAVNGGVNSFSPTLYLLKGRRAFKTYGKFDYIIVNIDETDIGDEWVSYRIPAVRDETGKIVAVPYENDLFRRYMWNGKLWAERSDFYVVRLIKFAFYYKILVPMLYKLTYNPDYTTEMQYVFAPDARLRFKKEHKYFYKRLKRMVQQLSELTTKSGKVYVTHHPQFRGVVDRVESGKLYLPIISEMLAKLKKETGVKVLDARDNIRHIHGEAFPADTYLADDPFSHLNRDGSVRYGKWLVSQIDLK
jgi:hypothetical protein